MRSIITLLQDDIKNINKSHTFMTRTSPQYSGTSAGDNNNDKWIPVVYNCNRKNKKLGPPLIGSEVSTIPT
jgi:hypothetical protein